MHFILKSRIFLLFNSLVFLATVLSLNYSVGNYVLSSEMPPFDLSHNYEVYEKVSMENIDLKEFLNDQTSNYVMILENHNKDKIGIYDPMMNYYLKSNKVSSPNFIRYFSKEDYVNGKNVGICVNGCSLFDFASLSSLGEELNLEIINCFENSPLNVNHISVVHNLFSMEEKIGDHVYIDSENKQTLNQLDKTLQKAGYQKLNKPTRQSMQLLQAIKFGLDSKHSSYLIFSNMILLILSALTSYVYIEKMKRRIKLNFFYGCTVLVFFKMFVIPYILFTILSSIVITRLLDLFISDLLYLSLAENIVILIAYCLYLVVVYFVNFLRVYKDMEKGYQL